MQNTKLHLHYDPIQVKNGEREEQNEIVLTVASAMESKIKGDSHPFPPDFKSLGDFSKNTKSTVL